MALLSPQHAELPLQAVRTPRHRGPVRGISDQDIQLRRGVGHDVEKIDGFQMGNQDGQHLVLCEIPAGDAVHVHRQEPVPLPLRAVREAEFPAAHGKRPVMAVDSVMARPLDKLFRGQHVLLKHRQRGLIPHGEIHSLAFERKPGFPPGLKPSGKQLISV